MWVGKPPHTRLTVAGRAGHFGFLQGVKISKIRGQISGLGVKLWVVDDGLSQCRAILYGVKIGVAANFGQFYASRETTVFQSK